MGQLTIIRHTQSIWNLQNRFTGWVDIPLSEQGAHDAQQLANKLAHQHYDVVFTSSLLRAIETAIYSMRNLPSGQMLCRISDDDQEKNMSIIYNEDAQQSILPMYTDWRLNERHYGELQGKNKQQLVEEFGKEQVQKWRRGLDDQPPGGESLAQTATRVISCFDERIVPLLQQGKNVIIFAHGNSLRALIMSLEELSASKISEVELNCGVPKLYQYENSKFKLTD